MAPTLDVPVLFILAFCPWNNAPAKHRDVFRLLKKGEGEVRTHLIISAIAGILLHLR